MDSTSVFTQPIISSCSHTNICTGCEGYCRPFFKMVSCINRLSDHDKIFTVCPLLHLLLSSGVHLPVRLNSVWEAGRSVVTIKGSLTREFRLQVFFISQWPPGLWVSHWDRFEFFRKFAEIIANECLSPVSTTPAKKDKNFEIKIFKIFY